MNVAPAPSEAHSVAVVPGHREVMLVLTGDLDAFNVDAVDRQVRELRRAGVEEVVLDLRALTFLDSKGLRLLMRLRDDARRDGHGLALLPGPATAQRLFDVTATRPLFDWRA